MKKIEKFPVVIFIKKEKEKRTIRHGRKRQLAFLLTKKDPVNVLGPFPRNYFLCKKIDVKFVFGPSVTSSHFYINFFLLHETTSSKSEGGCFV